MHRLTAHHHHHHHTATTTTTAATTTSTTTTTTTTSLQLANRTYVLDGVRKAYWKDIVSVREFLRTHVDSVPGANALLESVPSAALLESNAIQNEDVENFLSLPENVDPLEDPKWHSDFPGG